MICDNYSAKYIITIINYKTYKNEKFRNPRKFVCIEILAYYL